MVNSISIIEIDIFICALGSLFGYTSEGIYVDTMLNADGCDSIRILNLSILPLSDILCSTTSLENVQFASKLSIYPNPTANKLFISHKEHQGLLNYQIYTIEGQMVGRGSFRITTSVDVSRYDSGVYLIKIFDVDKSAFRKIVKIQD